MSYFLREAERIAKQAKDSKQSLTGDSSYADKFHECQTQVIRAFNEFQTTVSPVANLGLQQTLSDIEEQLSYFFNPKTLPADRRDLRRHIDMLVKTEVEPALALPSQYSEEFLPIEIVADSRGYVVNVARQVNRCFQYECLDACGVMIRRLLETLIIEVFDKKGLANRIKDANGNYLMFTDLVSRLTNSPETPVGKTVRKELPNTAIVLNNCAHSRTFNVSRAQLKQHQTVIVITVQELMGLWDVHNP